MSIYYSKFALNTYLSTPYFEAHIPKGYPLDRVMLKCRSFRRLPPHLQELAGKAKEWAIANGKPPGSINEYYDDIGREIDPGDGHVLTDEEIDAQWEPIPALDSFVVRDIPRPRGGFPDPDTWEPPEGPPEEEEEEEPPVSREQLIKDVALRGAEYTARYYGIDVSDLPTQNKEGDFFDRTTAAVTSPYFDGREDERAFLINALGGADCYDDFGGWAKELFDRAELITNYNPDQERDDGQQRPRPRE